ncbi:ribosomal RNA small subunit methyltransferase A [bacterium]|nr:MAG: ribosomal RNA small subunit methyltransferase A [bacterium]
MQIKPKKRLGQSFLIDPNIKRKIISACGLSQKDTVLEIGSGRGELTKLIAESAGSVLAVEIDTSLTEILKNNLIAYPNVKIINRDILKLDLSKLPVKFGKKLKVIGNIPYYISTPIIEYLLKYRKRVDSIHLTVQKEYARRLVALPGGADYGSLSCFLQYHSSPEILFYIKRSCFFPAPRVDSAFVRLTLKPNWQANPEKEKLLFKVIRAAFNQRRKTLRNSLKDTIPAQKLEQFFKKYSLDRNIRPEKLSLTDFSRLTNN